MSKAGFKQSGWGMDMVNLEISTGETWAEGEDGAGEGKNESFSCLQRSDGRGWGRQDSEAVFLPDSGSLRISAKEFWVVFVRQWVNWKDSEQEKLLELGRLI